MKDQGIAHAIPLFFYSAGEHVTKNITFQLAESDQYDSFRQIFFLQPAPAARLAIA